MTNWPINHYPVGSVVRCRFAFITRPLTDAELATFLSSGILPAGIGTTPAVVLFDYEPPGLAIVTVSDGSIVADGVGAYHRFLPLVNAGPWMYRGRGTDLANNPVAATSDRIISADRDFPT